MRPLLAALAALLLLVGIAQAQEDKKPKFTLLPTETRKALEEALTGLTGEYAGVALNAAVVEKYGTVEPYSFILKDEVRHRTALQELFRKFRLAYPKNPYLRIASAPGSLQLAAVAGVEMAKRNIAMYDRLLPDVKDYPDVTRIFRKLQVETHDIHLPLLQKAAENGGVLPRKRTIRPKRGHDTGSLPDRSLMPGNRSGKP